MLTKVILATNIDSAAEEIIKELKEDAADTARSTSSSSSSSKSHNIIYFDGWDGLGASAVLREVGRRLSKAASVEEDQAPAGSWRALAAAGQEFSQIFHVDCSKWESRRAMQRMIVEQLELPPWVMDMLDAQDEEDDYQGIAKGSRTEIPQIAEVIWQHIQKLNRRFLVIFHNGGNEEIDLDSFGFPLSGYSNNKVLWSFQGRFRLYPRTKVNRALESTRMTDVVLSAPDYSYDIISHEAAEVAHEINNGGIGWTAEAVHWFYYMMQLCGMGNRFDDYDLATHGFNYWTCDGITQLQQEDVGTHDDGGVADRLWLSSDALQRVMRLDADHYQNPYLTSPVVRRSTERLTYWSSPTYGFMMIPAGQYGRIPKGMFQQFDKLCVLKLSQCTFSFTSPPFLCCHSLRFLWLDGCRDRSNTCGVGNEEDIRRFLQRLWVLDMRHSSSTFLSAKMMGFMTQLRELNVKAFSIDDMDVLLQGRLHNARKLRLMNSFCHTASEIAEILFSGRDKMELLEYRRCRKRLFTVSSCSSLESLIIDQSNCLEVIYLERCAKLKNPRFTGFFESLYKLHLIGCEAVEILDLSRMAAPKLDELILLDCGKLCAILWPLAAEDKRKRYLGKVHIRTAQEKGTVTSDIGRTLTEFDWYLSVRDARLLWSLEPVKGPNHAHVEISTPASCHARRSEDNGTKNISGQQVQRLLQGNATYADVAATYNNDSSMQQHEANNHVCMPSPRYLTPHDCYVHIEDQMTRTKQIEAACRIYMRWRQDPGCAR